MRIMIAAGLLGAALTATTGLSAQDMSQPATYGNITLQGGFLPDPHVVQLTAGGSISANVSGCTYGYVANAPDVELTYQGNGQRTLYIYVESDYDTTLLINLPNGSWTCDDDGLGNRNPIITVRNAPSGVYDIWVGTYGSEMQRATLKITEINPR